MRTFAQVFAPYDRVVVLSGSCAVHVRLHAASKVSAATTEFCAFLHDEVGLSAVQGLDVAYPERVGLHIGCHGLRGLGLAKPSELQTAPFNKVRALLNTVHGLTIAEPRRPDECCGFGGTFAITEPAVSAKMGRDRLRDYTSAGATAVVSTDMSCLMHLGGLARRERTALPMLHVVEVLAGAA